MARPGRYPRPVNISDPSARDEQQPASGSSSAGIGAAVAAVVVWGLGNSLIAGLDLDGLALAFYRLGLGALFYLAILYGRGSRLTKASFVHGWQGGVAFGANIATFFV